MKCKVYRVTPRLGCYGGWSLVAAHTAEEANQIINKFIKDDPKNYMDSWGYDQVSEYDVVENVYSEQEGIVYMGIYYSG